MTSIISKQLYYLGIDLHKQTAYWTVLDEDRSVVWQKNTKTTKEGIEEAVESVPGEPHLYKAAIESITNAPWYAGMLERFGMEVKIVNPLAVGLIARNRLKTDKADSKILAELLRNGFLPECYRAPAKIRNMRETVRFRQKLVRIRTIIKNRMHSLLAKEGIQHKFSDLFGKEGILWLREESKTFPTCDQMDSLFKLLDDTNAEIERFEHTIRTHNKHSSEIQILKTIPGIGDVSACTILAEVGDFGRFPTANKLASYAGLVPSSRSSGPRDKLGHITKKGSRTLRFAMVQAAQRIPPKYEHLHSLYRKVSKKKGTKVARVAVARKLLVIAYHLIKKKEPFQILSFEHSSSVKHGSCV